MITAEKILVKHADGRRGIAYKKDQLPKFQTEHKLVVQFIKQRGKPIGRKQAVKIDKLTLIGYVD